MKRPHLLDAQLGVEHAAAHEARCFAALADQHDAAHDAAAFMLWTLAVAKLDDAVRTLGRAAFAEAKQRHAAAQKVGL